MQLFCKPEQNTVVSMQCICMNKFGLVFNIILFCSEFHYDMELCSNISINTSTLEDIQVLALYLLFGWYLSHVESHTDDFPRLHSNSTGGFSIPTSRRVECGHRSIFYALPPLSSLPVINCTRMIIAIACFLQHAAIWALKTTQKK